MTLNLRTDEGRDLLLRLAEGFDVVIESFRPGVLDRLGVGWEALRRTQPAARLLRDHRVRAGRAALRGRRPRRQLHRLRRRARDHREGRRPAGHPRRAGRRPRRGRHGRGDRDPRRAAPAGADRRGRLLRHLDDGRRVLVAVDPRGRVRRDEGVARARADASVRASTPATASIPAADGWLSVGALEPQFWAALCDAIERPDLLDDALRSRRAEERSHRGARAALRERRRAPSGWRISTGSTSASDPSTPFEEAFADPQILASGHGLRERRARGRAVDPRRQPAEDERGARTASIACLRPRWGSTPLRCSATSASASPRSKGFGSRGVI